MAIKIGINGFGRIGRLIVRQIEQLGLASSLDVVAINDLTDPKTLAHLFKYDSVHRTFPGKVHAHETGISINGNEIKILSEKDPSKLPWKELGAELVLECTGIFTSKEKASLHLQAGAKKVIISAPSNDADVTLVLGVNQGAYDSSKHNVISNGSCTTNCLAPVAKVLVDNFGIERASMTTIHSYTNDQNILDLPHKDLRRARAACMSMIPTSTGAAKALGLVIPELAGKADGFAVRVPTADVSMVDFVAELSKDTTKEEINNALKSAAEGSMKGYLAYSNEPLVSSDYIGDPHSSTVDAQSTMILGKRLAKVVAWYDNEMGFSTRMVDLCKIIGAGLNRSQPFLVLNNIMKLLCANWKMNLGIVESSKLTTELVELSKRLKKTEVWVACTSPALFLCGEVAKGSKVLVGAQNAYHQEKGAFTGEVSSLTLKEAQASFSLIGHSERRILFGKTNQLCAESAIGLLRAGIKVIFCIGETLQERQGADGETVRVLESQLKGLLEELSTEVETKAKELVENLLIAYEPVWAIGTGLAATTDQIAEVHAAIPKIWEKYSKLECPRILYGGSMNKSNCAEILAVPGVAGGLIGGASNSFESFSALVEIAEQV